jgi:hypothetical protein
MKTLIEIEIQDVNGGLACTGGDWAAYQELIRKYPYLLSIN